MSLNQIDFGGTESASTTGSLKTHGPCGQGGLDHFARLSLLIAFNI